MALRRVLIIDTSVLCCLLRVPGKETAGSGPDQWDYDRIRQVIDEEQLRGSTFVLPLATLIETGNHIAQSPRLRFEIAKKLSSLLQQSANAESPWAMFSDQAELWTNERLRSMADDWPTLAAGGTSFADATIKSVAEYYAQAGQEVLIVTGDKGLEAYQPASPVSIPRRRKHI